jgi:predicted Zn-dependent protease
MAQSRTRPTHRRRAKSARSRPRLRNRTSVLVVAVVGGFVLGLLFLAVGPKLISSWEESRCLTRAGEGLKRGDFNSAVNFAHQALRFDRDSLPAFRILAEATEKQNRAETVMWRAQIARLQPRDVDSQLNLASAALRFGQLDVARNALEIVPKESRESAAYNVVAGWLARAQGDDAGVDRHFAAAVEKEPANELYQFNLAALRIKSPHQEKSAAARETLERLAKVAPFRAGSLRALLSDAVLRDDFPEADRYAQELQMSPQVTFSDYLLCLDFYKKLDEKKFVALLEKVKPVAARLSSNLALLLAWMNSHGMAADALRWTEKLPSEEITKPPTAIEIADALSLQKNWSRLRRWTRGGSWGEDDYLRLAYQAYAARQTRQSAADAESGSLWRAAEHACEENTEREIRLARLASKWNLPTQAEQLWLRVAHNPLTRREALDALFEIYRSNNDLPNLYLTAMRLHETSPNEPLLAAEYARLSILLDRNAKEGQRVAQEAFDEAPNEPLCTITQALSLYSLGRASEGIQILKKLPPEKLHEPHNAVYAAVLLLDQAQFDAAREFIDSANAAPIFVEEKKLLQEALQKNQPSQSPAPSPSATANVMPPPLICRRANSNPIADYLESRRPGNSRSRNSGISGLFCSFFPG